MNIEDLMKPRYKVIADYPNCPYNVGRVLSLAKNTKTHFECKDAPASTLVAYPNKYPVVFRRLGWWQDRHLSDMPDYVNFITKPFEATYKVKTHNFLQGWCKVVNGTVYPYNELTPATEQDYNNYINKTK